MNFDFSTILFHILDIIGFGLNIGFAYLIFSSQYLRKPIFIFMACFAVCDTIYCFTSFFMTSTVFSLGEIGCKIFQVSYDFAAETKILLIILVTFIYTIKSDVNSSTMRFVIGSSLLLGLCHFLLTFESEVHHDDQNLTCFIVEAFHFRLELKLLLKFILPLCAAGTIIIIFLVGKLREMIKQLEVTKMFAITLIIYVIVSTPLAFFTYLVAFSNYLITTNLNNNLQILASFGPIYKPIFFYYKCSEIRNEISGINLMFGSRKRIKREQIDQVESS